ncbi:hypothetical protein C5S39_12200 [Candidatus Methanophagaceae archaeon]|nr:hypothetical protein C5S39_12200 [Methanophagales archaeon]
MFGEEPGGIMPIPEEGSIFNHDYDLEINRCVEKSRSVK